MITQSSTKPFSRHTVLQNRLLQIPNINFEYTFVILSLKLVSQHFLIYICCTSTQDFEICLFAKWPAVTYSRFSTITALFFESHT